MWKRSLNLSFRLLEQYRGDRIATVSHRPVMTKVHFDNKGKPNYGKF